MNEKNICNLYVVRHGQTDWNNLKKLQGSTDIPLNDEGRAQASLLKEQFKDLSFDAVFSSDLVRAKETAEIISDGRELELITSPLLRERSWGSHEGQSFDDLKLKYGSDFHPVIEEFDPDFDRLHPDLKQVESYAQSVNRIVPYLNDIKSRFSGKSVLVVSHGGVLKGLLLYLKLQEFKKPYVNNTAFLHLEACDKHFTLKFSQGITSH